MKSFTITKLTSKAAYYSRFYFCLFVHLVSKQFNGQFNISFTNTDEGRK